ncbi:MAG: hypothetical protein ACREK8_01010 [Gemmatimonadales bacterium]
MARRTTIDRRLATLPWRSAFTAAATTAVLASCSNGDGSTSGRIVITKYAGDGQSVIASLPVPIPPAVRVTNNGQSVADDTVTFAIADPPDNAGGGMVTGAVKVTGADGVATVGGWTPGVAGGHTLAASIIGSNATPVTFIATATAYPLLVNVVSGTDGQSAHAGTAVATPPRVLVRLAVSGNGLTPVAGATVTFTVGAGGGSVAGGVVITDADGMAAVGSWTLGPVAGPNTLLVTVSPFPDVRVTFTATGTP